MDQIASQVSIAIKQVEQEWSIHFHPSTILVGTVISIWNIKMNHCWIGINCFDTSQDYVRGVYNI
jgi:hypothetical protein